MFIIIIILKQEKKLFKMKRLLDCIFSLLILTLTLPITLIISLLIFCEDGGPILFKQIRIGKNGKKFNCLKFRTMVINAEELKEQLMCHNEQDGPVFKIKNDPRITKIGKFLRKTSLDEFPQFINVLMGDMSIVGPRPAIECEVNQYNKKTLKRISVKPGITCIWQVSGRNNIPFKKWVKMDLYYIENKSLKMDLTIMLKTIKVIFSGNGQ